MIRRGRGIHSDPVRPMSAVDEPSSFQPASSQAGGTQLQEPIRIVQAAEESNSAAITNNSEMNGSKHNDFGEKALSADFDPIIISKKPVGTTFVLGRIRGISSRVVNQDLGGAQLSTEKASDFSEQQVFRSGRGRGISVGYQEKSDANDNSSNKQGEQNPSFSTRGSIGAFGAGRNFGRNVSAHVNNASSLNVNREINRGMGRGCRGNVTVSHDGRDFGDTGSNAYGSAPAQVESSQVNRGMGRGMRGSRGNFAMSNSGTEFGNTESNACGSAPTQMQSSQANRGMGRGMRGSRGNANGSTSGRDFGDTESNTYVNAPIQMENSQANRGMGRGMRGSRGNATSGRDFGNTERNGGGSAPNQNERFQMNPPEQRRNDQHNNDRNTAGHGGMQNNKADVAKKPASTYVPVVRSMEDLIKEDIEQMEFYATIADEDEEVTFSGLGNQIIVALDTWEDAKFEGILYRNIVENSKYARPRKIQGHTIPLILEGLDVKGHAETGSGKTAAFMLPILNSLMKSKPKPASLSKPSAYAIIIEPTRELCLQVFEQGIKWAKDTGVKVAKAYGQFDMRVNRREVKDGCDILCVTPGRLKQLVYDNWVDLTNIRFLVLDEADRLMDQSFFVQENGRDEQKCFLDVIRDVMSIKEFPKKEKRQNLLFSATFPAEVMKLGEELLRENVVTVSKNKLVAPNMKINQTFMLVESSKKSDVLLELLQNAAKEAAEKNVPMSRYLIFVAKKKSADTLSLYLSQQDIKAQSINGDRSQSQRECALKQFRVGDVVALVATDVCARGIDIKGLDYVINYDLPNFKGRNPLNPDDEKYDERPVSYVHRVGRTGRLRAGTSISFFDNRDDNDIQLAAVLIKFMRDSNQTPPDFLIDAAEEIVRLNAHIDDTGPFPPTKRSDANSQPVPKRTEANSGPVPVPTLATKINDDWD